MPDPSDDDHGSSLLSAIRSQRESGRTRTQGSSCDECGTQTGSMIQDREAGWTLCRTCFNDPEVLGEYVD